MQRDKDEQIGDGVGRDIIDRFTSEVEWTSETNQERARM